VLALVLPISLGLWFLAFLPKHGWRDASIRALVLFGALTAAVTEGLSAISALRSGQLFGAWLAVSAVAFVYWKTPKPAGFSRWPALDILLVAGTCAIALAVGLTALLSPPNTWDALAYHVPRVVHWAQAGTVSFFPAHYLNEILQPPLAEYLMLHTYVLSGGDRYVNLVQFLGFLGSAIGGSLVAQSMGGGGRAQVMASLFCVTIPNGILQASGAKNDCLLSFWLVVMVHFALRFLQSGSAANLGWSGVSLGLALLTKATAYLFAPAVLLGLVAGHGSFPRRPALRLAAVFVVSALSLNLPQYWRNASLSGSPLGFASPFGDERFRWVNERSGVGPTVSNVLRNLSDHLGRPSPAWNEGVHRFVVGIHAKLGLDSSDPTTTWQWTKYGPPQSTRHEANAPNTWHLLLLVSGFAVACFRSLRLRRTLVWYFAGIALGFLLFCAVLKWQPYVVRLHLPLFVLGAPAMGVMLERLRPALVPALVCLFLLLHARPFALGNWLRPLTGPDSVWRTARDTAYFTDIKTSVDPAWYHEAARRTLRSGCSAVGIDNEELQLEYPYQALLLRENPRIRFLHPAVRNPSARYRPLSREPPCAILCLNCAGNDSRLERYKATGEPLRIGKFVLFLAP